MGKAEGFCGGTWGLIQAPLILSVPLPTFDDAGLVLISPFTESAGISPDPA